MVRQIEALGPVSKGAAFATLSHASIDVMDCYLLKLHGTLATGRCMLHVLRAERAHGLIDEESS